MDSGKIIYEKQFPKLTMMDYSKMLEETEKDLPSFKRQDSDTFFQNLLKDVVRIVIPDRLENCDFFISMAKQVAEHNGIDIVITEYEDRYVAEFHVDNDSTSFGLKDLIGYADHVSFGCEDGNAIVGVIYYTHATYRAGKQVAPEKRFEF